MNERNDFIRRLTDAGFGETEAGGLFDHLSNWGGDEGGLELVPKALMGTSIDSEELAKERGRDVKERADFIARMEASGIAPTWDTIYDLNVAVAALRADLATVERERDIWKRELRDILDAGVDTLRKVQHERDRYQTALDAAGEALRRIYDSRGDGDISDLQQIAFEGLCDIGQDGPEASR